MKKLLHLHVKTVYFDQIKSGEKPHEYRLQTNYWIKRLVNKRYDGIVVWNAYKTGPENQIEMPWKGCHSVKITHEHFGPDEVMVFAIRMTVPQ